MICKNKKLLFVGLKTFCCLFFLLACKEKESNTNSSSSFLSPESGAIVKLGDEIKLKVSFANAAVDSVIYFIDSLKVAAKKDSTAFFYKTDNLSLGSRLLSAQIFRNGTAEEVNTNIVIVPSKAPEMYSYKVVSTYAHDTTSYTQGLEYHDGIFYESDGENGGSSLRKVNVNTGKVLKQLDFPLETFAEGIAVYDDKIVMLTWQQNTGFVFDKNTFEQKATFPYQNSKEGWGLCFNGKNLYKSDGTNKIYLLNKDNYKEEGFIEVYDEKGPVTELNELEYIDGKIYANIYTSNLIAIINTQSGEVEAYINLTGLLKDPIPNPDNYVLNGIAWDVAGKKLYVTGKKWPKLFEIEIIKNY